MQIHPSDREPWGKATRAAAITKSPELIANRNPQRDTKNPDKTTASVDAAYWAANREPA
jgi:hypothetical protein